MPPERTESDEPTVRTGFLARLRARVNRGASWVADLLPGGKIDDALLEDLETRLLAADVGVEATESVLADLHRQIERKELGDAAALREALRAALFAMLQPVEKPLVVDRARRPFVILVVGVNGSGKTTTIGKLARRLKNEGLAVMLAAGDTFRAAAVEQLAVWAERNGVPLISQAAGCCRSCRHRLRRAAGRESARNRRADRGHRGPAEHAVAPDGRARQGRARDQAARRGCTARDPRRRRSFPSWAGIR